MGREIKFRVFDAFKSNFSVFSGLGVCEFCQKDSIVGFRKTMPFMTKYGMCYPDGGTRFCLDCGFKHYHPRAKRPPIHETTSLLKGGR